MDHCEKHKTHSCAVQLASYILQPIHSPEEILKKFQNNNINYTFATMWAVTRAI